MAKVVKRRQKKYKPQTVDPHAHIMALHMAKPLSEDMKVAFIKNVDIAILAISREVGNSEHFYVLATMVEVSLIFIGEFFNETNYADDLMKAREGLYRCQSHYFTNDTIVLDEAALHAIKAAVLISRELLNQITIAEFVYAIKKVEHMLTNGEGYHLDQANSI